MAQSHHVITTQESVFEQFLQTHSTHQCPTNIKEKIRKQALLQCNFPDDKKNFSHEEANQFSEKLNHILRFCNNAFQLFSSNELEKTQVNESVPEKIKKCCRNILKYYLIDAPLDPGLTIDSLNKILGNRTLFEEFRIQLLQLFKNIIFLNELGNLSDQQRRQLNLQIQSLLTLYCLFNPKQGETIHIPVQINQEWKMVEFQINVLNYVENDEKYALAYKFIPIHPDQSHPYFLFSERVFKEKIEEYYFHYRDEIFKWIAQNNDSGKVKFKLIDHGYGSILSLLLTLDRPYLFDESICFSPPSFRHKLSDEHLSLLTWDKIPEEKKSTVYPSVWIFMHEGTKILDLSFMKPEWQCIEILKMDSSKNENDQPRKQLYCNMPNTIGVLGSAPGKIRRASTSKLDEPKKPRKLSQVFQAMTGAIARKKSGASKPPELSSRATTTSDSPKLVKKTEAQTNISVVPNRPPISRLPSELPPLPPAPVSTSTLSSSASSLAPIVTVTGVDFSTIPTELYATVPGSSTILSSSSDPRATINFQFSPCPDDDWMSGAFFLTTFDPDQDEKEKQNKNSDQVGKSSELGFLSRSELHDSSPSSKDEGNENEKRNILG